VLRRWPSSAPGAQRKLEQRRGDRPLDQRRARALWSDFTVGLRTGRLRQRHSRLSLSTRSVVEPRTFAHSPAACQGLPDGAARPPVDRCWRMAFASQERLIKSGSWRHRLAASRGRSFCRFGKWPARSWCSLLWSPPRCRTLMTGADATQEGVGRRARTARGSLSVWPRSNPPAAIWTPVGERVRWQAACWWLSCARFCRHRFSGVLSGSSAGRAKAGSSSQASRLCHT
jgi:hypothetical protein